MPARRKSDCSGESEAHADDIERSRAGKDVKSVARIASSAPHPAATSSSKSRRTKDSTFPAQSDGSEPIDDTPSETPLVKPTQEDYKILFQAVLELPFELLTRLAGLGKSRPEMRNSRKELMEIYLDTHKQNNSTDSRDDDSISSWLGVCLTRRFRQGYLVPRTIRSNDELVRLFHEAVEKFKGVSKNVSENNQLDEPAGQKPSKQRNTAAAEQKEDYEENEATISKEAPLPNPKSAVTETSAGNSRPLMYASCKQPSCRQEAIHPPALPADLSFNRYAVDGGEESTSETEVVSDQCGRRNEISQDDQRKAVKKEEEEAGTESTPPPSKSSPIPSKVNSALHLLSNTEASNAVQRLQEDEDSDGDSSNPLLQPLDVPHIATQSRREAVSSCVFFPCRHEFNNPRAMGGDAVFDRFEDFGGGGDQESSVEDTTFNANENAFKDQNQKNMPPSNRPSENKLVNGGELFVGHAAFEPRNDISKEQNKTVKKEEKTDFDDNEMTQPPPKSSPIPSKANSALHLLSNTEASNAVQRLQEDEDSDGDSSNPLLQPLDVPHIATQSRREAASSCAFFPCRYEFNNPRAMGGDPVFDRFEDFRGVEDQESSVEDPTFNANENVFKDHNQKLRPSENKLRDTSAKTNGLSLTGKEPDGYSAQELRKELSKDEKKTVKKEEEVGTESTPPPSKSSPIPSKAKSMVARSMDSLATSELVKLRREVQWLQQQLSDMSLNRAPVISVAPGELVTQPTNKIVINAPFEWRTSHPVKLINSSSAPIGWMMMASDNVSIKPDHGILSSNEEARVEVAIKAIVNMGQHDDRINLEWKTSTDNELVNGDGLLRRKTIFIEYNN